MRRGAEYTVNVGAGGPRGLDGWHAALELGPAEFGWVARGFGAGGPRFWMAHKNKNSITLVLVWHKSVNTTSATSTSYSSKGCEYDAMGPPCKPCTYNTDLYIYIHIHFGFRTPTLQPALLSNLHGCCNRMMLEIPGFDVVS